ncbi:MAG TPA: hypothetical protein VHC20_00460 [Candidatus Paceibacterota bacterium]|nr:hypothetical protein [Candidatus Paceibacterota bacterium]
MTYFTRTTLIVLMLATLGGSIVTAPRPAYAIGVDAVITLPGSVTLDPANLAVNTTLAAAYQARKGPLGTGISLDTLGWTIGKIAIQMMTKSVVNWINSGFKGSPSFITNFQGFLTQVADVTAHSFISQLSSNSALKSPFQSQVAQATAQQYALGSSQTGFFTSIAYGLNKITSNDSAFLAGNFSQGGWGAWYAASQYPQNNPLGARLVAASALQAQIDKAQAQHTTQASWGQGFLSWCGDATGGGGGANEGGSCHTDDDCAGSLACVDPPEGHCAVDPQLDGTTAQTCTTKDGATGTIQTPGSVIQAQLNKTLGIQGDTLVTADEFNEVIGALLSQLVSQVLGGTGLSGVSSSGYLARATDPSQITGAQATSTENATLATSINSELQSLQQYQTDLGTVLTAAQQGKLAAGQCNNTGSTTENGIAGIITQIQAEQAKTATAIAGLQKISNDATAALAGAGTGLSTVTSSLPSITQVSTEFQAFLASPATPSNTDIANAHQEAQQIQSGDTTGGSGGTGYLQTLLDYLKQLAQCGG